MNTNITEQNAQKSMELPKTSASESKALSGLPMSVVIGSSVISGLNLYAMTAPKPLSGFLHLTSIAIALCLLPSTLKRYRSRKKS